MLIEENAAFRIFSKKAEAGEKEKSNAAVLVSSTRRDYGLALLLFFVMAVFFASNSVAPVIFDDNEGLYAGAVREMTARHDWLLPTNNGLPRVQKPPLVYWCSLISTHLLGLNEFAFRLPNALFTAAWITITYLIGLRLRDARFGLAGALILASMVGVFIFTHLVQPEPVLATFLSLSIYCLLSAHAQPEKANRWFLLAWISMGLGSISKGLHGAAWPLGVVILSALFFPQVRATFRRFLSWPGLALFLMIVAPWYVMLEWRLPHVLQDHFFNEQLGAALDTRYPHETRSVSLWAFYLQHLIFFVPWTLFIPTACLAWKCYRPLLSAREKELWSILAVWVGLTFLSLSFSNLQDYYAMTCWGALALALAVPFCAPISIRRSYFAAPLFLLVLGGLGGLIFSYFFTEVLTGATATAAPMASRDTFANAIGGFSAGVWKRFIPLMQLCSWDLFLGGGLAFILALRAKSRFSLLLILALTIAIPFCAITYAFTVISPYFSLAVPAEKINAAAQPDAVIACESAPHQSSSLFYYLNFPVHWVNARFDSNYAGRVLGIGNELYLNSDDLVSLWNSKKQVFLIIEESRFDDWQNRLAATAHQPREFLRSGSRVVLVNH